LATCERLPRIARVYARQTERAAEIVPIRNLGVDNWAWRKGQEYGTILVNLDRHRVVDLLPDRAAESFSEWLESHPEIATISRDRCGLYAEEATLGPRNLNRSPIGFISS
jgi:transposase